MKTEYNFIPEENHKKKFMELKAYLVSNFFGAKTVLDCSSTTVMVNTYMPSFIQTRNESMDTPELEDVDIISPFF